jgi:NifU-like protein involved in Fe-S cluster formation
VMNDAVISSMVATEVKKQTSTEAKMTADDVERMIKEAVGRIPQPAAVVMPNVMSEEAITKLVESKLPKAISEEEINRLVESKLPKQEGAVMNDAVISSMVATEVKKQTSTEAKMTADDVERMIKEAVGRIPKQVYIQENTNSNHPNTNSFYNPKMVTPTLTIPVIRKKNAKAPENDKRADQFKSVIAPEVGVTRTGRKKIIRIPFQDRMSKAEPLLLAHYDELKNYILSFQVKSRISNAGDIFRLHKEEYVKITIAGKGLKLYMALNPEDYKDGPIPVDDASDKKMYKQIPLVFKVKSELSLKRAKKLIDDLMAKKGLPQKEIPFLPWSKAFQK